MSGKIHFVTPTNRWIGSIPLSTLDPLTLEPLSTYLRHSSPTEEKEPYGEGKDSTEIEEDVDRTTNMTGQPVSLILARLQTTPHGCACGCTVPSPPRHSDYYHAQHLLRLLFQTQRVRSRSIKNHLPQYFDRHSDTDDDDEAHGPETINPTSVFSSSVVIPIDAPHTNTTTDNQAPPKKAHRKQKIPKWVHSLVQNRAIRNPLTNTETQGEPTFFVVLEPGKGGWWHEPWAMATRPATMDGFPLWPSYQRHHHRHQPPPESEEAHQQPGPAEKTAPTPEMIQNEKEVRKERWRQARIANLEIEAQHELDWRRWQRSLLVNQSQKASRSGFGKSRGYDLDTNTIRRSLAYKKPRTRIMRFKIGKDMTLLEPSESALRLPKRVRRPKSVRASHSAPAANTAIHPSVQASAALDEMEMEDVRQQQNHYQQQTRDYQQQTHTHTFNSKDNLDCTPLEKQRSPTMPWWEPNPKPFTMPNTKLSPFAISTLPGPVVKLFGGTSIYAPRPKGSEQHQTQQAIEEPSSTEPVTTDSTTGKPTPSEPCADTNGCKWVPVQDGDRVAVMIGTSEDFLLFPSFQRLLLRHLSREDFQDRVGRVTVIPRPATTVVVEGRMSHDNGRRQQENREGEEGVPEDEEQGQRNNNRDEYGRRIEQGPRDTARRSWPRWLTSRGSRGVTSANATAPSSSIDIAPTSTSVEGTQPSTESLGVSQTTRGQTDSASESTLATYDIEKPSETLVEAAAKPVPTTTWTYDWEIFQREDYDSSEYSFSSGECSDEETQDALCYYSESTSSGEDADASSSSSDDDGHRRTRQTNTATLSSSCFSSLIHLILFFKRSPPPPESRGARQRRLRRERWQRHQDQLLHHQQSIPPRFLPARIRQRMGPTQTRRCRQVLEFCRFYITILMAISLMGAIVYSAVHVEQGRAGGHGRGPRVEVEPVYGIPELQNVDMSGFGDAVVDSGGGGGVMKAEQNVLKVDPVPPSGLKRPKPAPGSKPSVPSVERQEHSRRPQKPLAA
ncbi:hypothetical protein MVEG_11702 [Podila verticillata NRRL 6337]|uniref:Uncharacterized protein n=1 Tax=Podila verticillata NRRL 6337 TaxID=1069443 RepID=A0A086TKL7_9FUNG|nr:hypothetical protein MVEG_11702 [Podila verticillata NRRL 6337]